MPADLVLGNNNKKRSTHSNKSIVEVIDFQRRSGSSCGLERFQKVVLPKEPVGHVDLFEVGEQLQGINVTQEPFVAALQIVERRNVRLKREPKVIFCG